MTKATDTPYLALFVVIIFFLMAKNPLVPAIIFTYYLHKSFSEKLTFIPSLIAALLLGIFLSLAAMLLLFAVIGG